MRCRACDVLLTEYDLKQKDKTTGEHLDLCTVCRHESNQALYDEVQLEFDFGIEEV